VPLLPFYSFAVADFLADTQHMTTEEVGASTLLIIAAWNSAECGLLNDDVILARYVRLPKARWAKMRATVLKGWIAGTNGLLHHPTIDERRSYVLEKQTKARYAADAKWLKERGSRAADALRTQSVGTPNQDYNQNDKRIMSGGLSPIGTFLRARPLKE
jgi:uncharacterized protein YdaU (DUF1376 family)